MIEQIKIQNYKSIREAVIPLSNLNILIGSNGAGKSNLISFFELVKALLDQRLGSYVLQRGGIDRILHHGRKNSEFIRSLIDFNNTNAIEFEIRPTTGSKAYIEFTKDYFNKNGVQDKNYKELWHPFEWDKSVEESAILTNPKWRAGYIRSFLRSFTVYHFHDTSITSPMRQASKIGDNEYLRHDGSNLAAFLYKLKVKHEKEYNRIEGVIRSIAPYFKRFNLKPDNIMDGYISLEWEEVGSDMYLDASNFSDGTLRFIALATLLLQPNPPKTIIVDEPELGLHPAAINKLGALIKRASNISQLIIATQSVSIVDYFSLENIIVVDRIDGQSTFKQLAPEDYNIWLENYSLGEIWEKNIIGGQP